MMIFALNLETAFLASTLASFVMLIGFILIKFLEKSIRGITLWILAYSFWLIKYLFLFILEDPWQNFFDFLFTVLFRLFLVIGLKQFFEIKYSLKDIGLFMVLIFIVDILTVLILKIEIIFLLAFSITLGFLCIYSGIIVLKNCKTANFAKNKHILIFIGMTFIFSGLHLLDYPFLRPISWFAPIGYMIGFCLGQMMAVGIFILIFQHINHMNMESKEKIMQLEGLLPICASCKKIRDVKGYWNQLEEYFLENSEIKFSHGLCDECIAKLYPEL